MTNRKILILCVNYNSDLDTKDFFFDVKSQSVSDQIQFIAVCNGSKSVLLDSMAEEYGACFSVYYCTKNDGYFNAAHDAYMSEKNKNLYQHIIVCNADVKLPDQYFFENYLREHRTGCVAAPRITTLDQRHQNPFLKRRPKKIRLLFLKWIFKFWLVFKIYSYLSSLRQLRERPSAGIDEGYMFIYAPHGSFIIFKQSYFSMGGTLEHDSLLYGEELHVGEQVRMLGQQIEYLPDLEVLHKEHAVTSSLGLKKKAYLLHLATENILKRYY